MHTLVLWIYEWLIFCCPIIQGQFSPVCACRCVCVCLWLTCMYVNYLSSLMSTELVSSFGFPPSPPPPSLHHHHQRLPSLINTRTPTPSPLPQHKSHPIALPTFPDASPPPPNAHFNPSPLPRPLTYLTPPTPPPTYSQSRPGERRAAEIRSSRRAGAGGRQGEGKGEWEGQGEPGRGRTCEGFPCDTDQGTFLRHKA